MNIREPTLSKDEPLEMSQRQTPATGRNLLYQSTSLVSPTQADNALTKLIDEYMKMAKELQTRVKDERQGIDSEYVDFLAVPYRRSTEFEAKLQKQFTTASCLEAEDATTRHARIVWYQTLATTFLVISILSFCCFCGTSCIKGSKMRPKNNFFGHNNGEDRLIINHHWQEESSEEPEPRYICVRDPNLKEIPTASNQ